jgi:putative transport protein
VEAVVCYINNVPLAGLMLVVAVGWVIGRIEVRGVSLSPAGGVLLMALLAGWSGVEFNRLYGADADVLPRMTIGTFGFALFIYAIGYEAGPRFFSALRGSGPRFVALALCTNLIALGTVLTMSRLMGLDGGAAAGALAGAMTSTPALVSASEVAPDIGQLTLAYAVAYPYGQIGLLLMVAIVPRLLRKPLSTAGSTDNSDASTDEDDADTRARSYLVENPDTDRKTLRELRLPAMGCIVARIKRGKDVILPGPEVHLKLGDIVMCSGRLKSLEQLETRLGQEVYDPTLRRSVPNVRHVLVSHRQAVGRTLAELNLPGRFDVVVVRIERGQQFIDPSGDLVLERYDVLDVVGRQAAVREAARIVGHLEQAGHETNIALYAAGILAGMLIGSISIPVAGVGVSLGAAGGLLLAGLLLGRFRRIGRFSANVPLPARQLVRDLGILLFVSEAGVQGGAALAGGFSQSPLGIVATGAVVTTVTVLGTLVIGQRILKLKPLDAWGAVCGGMTSTTSLEAVNRTAGNNDAVVGYAATYAVAAVLITLAGQLVVRLA